VFTSTTLALDEQSSLYANSCSQCNRKSDSDVRTESQLFYVSWLFISCGKFTALYTVGYNKTPENKQMQLRDIKAVY